MDLKDRVYALRVEAWEHLRRCAEEKNLEKSAKERDRYWELMDQAEDLRTGRTKET